MGSHLDGGAWRAAFADHQDAARGIETKTDALRLLISKGGDYDAKKKDGTTVLMIAAMLGHTGCVEDLIASGANIFAMDIYGYTARMLAAGDEACSEILVAAEEAQFHYFCGDSILLSE